MVVRQRLQLEAIIELPDIHSKLRKEMEDQAVAKRLINKINYMFSPCGRPMQSEDNTSINSLSPTGVSSMDFRTLQSIQANRHMISKERVTTRCEIQQIKPKTFSLKIHEMSGSKNDNLNASFNSFVGSNESGRGLA